MEFDGSTSTTATDAAGANAGGAPFRRIALYVHGFDPKGPGRYRALYRAESRRWTKLFGGRISATPGGRDALSTTWTMRAEGVDDAGAPPRPVEIRYTVLHWHDLVEARFGEPLWRRVERGLRTFASILWDGSLRHMLAQSWIPVTATLYPFAALTLYVLAALGVGIAAAALLGALTGVSALWFAPIAAMVGWGALTVAAAWDDKIFVFYIVDFFCLMRDHALGRASALDARIDVFAERVSAALDEPVDEVLVVGHSGGAMLAASAVARVIADRPDAGAEGPAFGVLTLGPNTLAHNQFPQADRQRADLRALAGHAPATWVEVSADADGVCFALCDPLYERGVHAPSDARRSGPKIVSAAFRNTMAPESFEKIRKNHFRRHLQYLYVFERPGAFDYFKITAGAKTLRARFAKVPTNKRAPKTATEAATEAAPGAAA